MDLAYLKDCLLPYVHACLLNTKGPCSTFHWLLVTQDMAFLVVIHQSLELYPLGDHPPLLIF